MFLDKKRSQEPEYRSREAVSMGWVGSGRLLSPDARILVSKSLGINAVGELPAIKQSGGCTYRMGMFGQAPVS